MNNAVRGALDSIGILSCDLQVRGAYLDDVFCPHAEIVSIKVENAGQYVYFVDKSFHDPVDVTFKEAASLHVIGRRQRHFYDPLFNHQARFDAIIVYTGMVDGDLKRNMEFKREMIEKIESYLHQRNIVLDDLRE